MGYCLTCNEDFPRRKLNAPCPKCENRLVELNDSFPASNDIIRLNNLKNSDAGFFQLALFSFIEAYIKYTYPELQIREDTSTFPNLIKKFREEKKSNQEEWNIINKLLGIERYSYGTEKGTHRETNGVRHYFKQIDEESLLVALDSFREFFRYQDIKNEEIKQKLTILGEEKFEIWDEKKSSYFIIDDGLVDCKSDLLDKYWYLKELDNEFGKITSELSEMENQLITQAQTDVNKLPTIINERQKKLSRLRDIERERAEYTNDTQILTELSYSLIKARTRKDFENRLIGQHLTSEQKSIIEKRIPKWKESSDNKSLLIRGGPGTGKTLVLIKILDGFRREASKEVMLLTFYNSLNKYIKYLFSAYNNAELFDGEKLTEEAIGFLRKKKIDTIDSYMHKKLQELFYVKNIYALTDETSEKVLKIFKEINPQIANDLYEIAVHDIWPNLLSDEECNKKYVDKWQDIKKVQEIMKSNENECLDLYIYYRFWEEKEYLNKDILDDQRIRYILVDEAQDLTSAQIFVIGMLTYKDGGCIFAGDMNQSIRNKNISWKKLGIDIVGNSVHLSLNCRSSKAIQNLGERYKSNIKIKEIKAENDKDLQAFLPGPEPQLFITNDTSKESFEDTYNKIITSVQMCIEDFYIAPENICIVSFEEYDLQIIKTKLKNIKIEDYENGVASEIITDENYKFENSVIRLSTVKSIKGIDCAVLMFMLTDKTGGISQDNRANAIYTCITRAMYLLQIFVPSYCKTKDENIARLINIIQPEALDRDILPKNEDNTFQKDSIEQKMKNLPDHTTSKVASDETQIQQSNSEDMIASNIKSNMHRNNTTDKPDIPTNVKKKVVVIKKKIGNYNVSHNTNMHSNKFKGKILGKTEDYLKIENTNANISWLDHIRAYKSENEKFYEKCANYGDTVYYTLKEEFINGKTYYSAIITDIEN